VTDEPAEQAAAQERSVRPVIEHALIDNGYSPDTICILLDRLITDARAE
jgi:hypothetical protein